MEQDPRVEQLAIAYWHRIRTGQAAWSRLKPEIRAQMLDQADTWLRAAEQADLLAPIAAPSEDHAALWLDETGGVWNDVPTSDSGDDLVLPLVHAREEATSRAELEDRGHHFTLIGWAR
ncbi:hypothetical protein GCM10010495_74160 [Kitasatospora herbaricolor]|uniref:hypothetical protein n=1 Tax=Kitasatospora herbaricolor TaxID=68217 RepID=UPI00174CE1DC|nr:hypothetical protein [Kitasatospora herbaricolor]MDQ0305468.1 hypothetical protein [Kitasatospora herbaricolor]GGV45723.1 hypothetical protein GCM10010495_74160 [Kitasatospora herbaricolor]